MAVKITIPVEFQDSAQSYKQVIAQLQSQLKKVKPGTAIYDNIKEQLKKAQKLGESLDLSFDKGISSSSDIDKITKTFSSLQRILTEVSNTYKGLSFEQLNIIPENYGDQAKEFTRVTNELLKAEKRLSEKKGSTVSSLVDGIERQSFGDDLLDRDAITVLKELEGAMAGVEQSAEEARKKVSDLEAELAE